MHSLISWTIFPLMRMRQQHNPFCISAQSLHVLMPPVNHICFRLCIVLIEYAPAGAAEGMHSQSARYGRYVCLQRYLDHLKRLLPAAELDERGAEAQELTQLVTTRVCACAHNLRMRDACMSRERTEHAQFKNNSASWSNDAVAGHRRHAKSSIATVCCPQVNAVGLGMLGCPCSL